MRQRSTALKARLDAMYRERALEAQLRATPLFRGVPDALIRDLCGSVELVSCDPGQEVFQEGEPADGVYLVRSGFVKLSQRLGAEPVVLTYLSKGMTFGEAEALLPGVDRWSASGVSMQYAELVKIGREPLRKLLNENPGIKAALWKSATDRIRELGAGRRRLADTAFVDTALETGLVQGNSVLVIDLERCTRCDDCVKGCASTHGGSPRFVREGEKVQNLLITKACFHCRDPLCLVGCPTGAIRRANVGATVEIDPALCIGCASCANNCPYDSIVMEDTGTVWGPEAVPERLRGQPRLLAQKCDLCHTRADGPACVKSCPNECATRVSSVDEFRALLRKE
jgi:Fe-S-cluster-containing dehydrogenase component/CRP-like cAMP-binding protein